MASGSPTHLVGNSLRSTPPTARSLPVSAWPGRDDYERVAQRAAEAFLEWRVIPAPRRGEIVREIADELRARKADLGALVTLEMGKILCRRPGRSAGDDRYRRFRRRPLAPALRADHAQRAPRPSHVRAVASAGRRAASSAPSIFRSRCGAWNAMIAAVCGDCVLWKPSPDTPLTAIAVQKICNRVLDRHGWRRLQSGDRPRRCGRREPCSMTRACR